MVTTLFLCGVAWWLLQIRQSLRQALPVLGAVADFTLTNQLGQAVHLGDLQGKAWVADVVFTRCAGPCPRMSQQMSQLQAAVPATSQARFITLTTDPGYDTPEVLRRYAQRYGANPDRWWFLTGDKLELARLATASLKLAALEKPPQTRQDAADLFIHSTIFVVVDRQGRLRAAVETQPVPATEEEAVSGRPSLNVWETESKDRLLKIISQLSEEN